MGNTINYGSFGTTADIDCADGKSLNVGGSNNTPDGEGYVRVGQHRRRRQQDRVRQHRQELSVVGLNNTVTYKAGDPKVNNLGSGNTINKG